MSKESLKIALASSTFLPYLGGAEVGLHNIAIRLQQRGHVPIVIVPYTNYRELKNSGWELPYEIVSLPPRAYALLYYWPLLGLYVLDRVFARLQRKYGFDFWHVTMGYPSGIAVAHFAEKNRDIHYLIRCAGEDIQYVPDINYGARQNPQIDRLIRKFLPKARHLVAISNSVADEYKALGVTDSQIHYIPNGIDLSRFSDANRRIEIRKSLGIREEEFIFLAVGRNHKKKNFSSLVEAAAIIYSKGISNFRILVVGDGSSRLLEQAEEKGVSGFILAKEHVIPDNKKPSMQLPADGLVDLYMAADCFAFPSLVETFGIVIIEAMAAGLPIITTDAPGCRDLIRYGKDGIMVPANDVNAFAENMLLVMSNVETRRDLVNASKERAKSFSWDNVVDRYIDVYQSDN